MHYNADEISNFLLDSNPDPAIATHLCICTKCRRLYQQIKDIAELLNAPAPGITLTPAQWIYIAALIGGDTFEGMPDALHTHNPSQREEAYAKAHDALIGKGYIETDFDAPRRARALPLPQGSTIKIKKHLYQIVNTCINFERLITLTRQTPGSPPRICNIYEKAGNSAVMYVNIANCTAIWRQSKTFFTPEKEGHPTETLAAFTPEELQNLRDEIKGFGGSSEGNILAQAIKGSAGYYSISEIKVNPGKTAKYTSHIQISDYDKDYTIVYAPDEESYKLFNFQ